MKQLLLSLIIILCAPVSLVLADDNEHQMPPPYTGSKALEKIKALEGKWEGTVRHEGGPQGKVEKTSVTYRVTSNGSAVIETIFENTPMEMTSVYYDLDGKLTMTHYCAVANRPTLSLKDSKNETIKMSYTDGEQMDVNKDMHIHGLELKIENPDQITQRWKGFNAGKETHSTVLELKRNKKS